MCGREEGCQVAASNAPEGQGLAGLRVVGGLRGMRRCAEGERKDAKLPHRAPTRDCRVGGGRGLQTLPLPYTKHQTPPPTPTHHPPNTQRSILSQLTVETDRDSPAEDDDRTPTAVDFRTAPPAPDPLVRGPLAAAEAPKPPETEAERLAFGGPAAAAFWSASWAAWERRRGGKAMNGWRQRDGENGGSPDENGGGGGSPGMGGNPSSPLSIGFRGLEERLQRGTAPHLTQLLAVGASRGGAEGLKAGGELTGAVPADR